MCGEEIELHSHESILQRRLNRILIQVSQMYAVAWYTRVNVLVRSTRLLTRQLMRDN
jgi:hypothetical protein